METLVGVSFDYLEDHGLFDAMLSAYCKRYPDNFHMNMDPIDMVSVDYAFEKTPDSWCPHNLWWEWSYDDIWFGVNITDFDDDTTIREMKNAFIEGFKRAFNYEVPYENVEIY